VRVTLLLQKRERAFAQSAPLRADLQRSDSSKNGMHLADTQRMLSFHRWEPVTLALVLAIVGCSAETVTPGISQPEQVRDLNAEMYGWVCDEHGYGCKGAFIDESPLPPNCSEDWHPSVVWTAGATRFFPLYVTCAHDESGTWLIDHWESRYLICDTDADCPNLVYADAEYRFECESGLCQNTDTSEYPRETLSPGEVAGLCRAGTPRQSALGISEEDYAAFSERIEEYCPEAGPGCEIPPECRQL
jgi:hypothetical protein